MITRRASPFIPQLIGATFGAGLASLASAAVPHPVSPSFGPPIFTIYGVDVPLFSAVFGALGVFLARRVAPASAAGARLGRTGNAALTGLLMMGIVALVIAGQKEPLVALGWAVGLGYSGLGIIELIARAVVSAVRVALQEWSAALEKAGQGKGSKP